MNIEEAVEQINKMLKIEKDCLHYDVCKQDIEAIETLLTAYEKEKETNKQIKCKLDEKNIPIETLLAEFERLEDLEDDLTTVYLNGVYDGEKKVQDKIKAKIEDLKENSNGDDFNLTNVIMLFKSLLKKE